MCVLGGNPSRPGRYGPRRWRLRVRSTPSSSHATRMSSLAQRSSSDALAKGVHLSQARPGRIPDRTTNPAVVQALQQFDRIKSQVRRPTAVPSMAQRESHLISGSRTVNGQSPYHGVTGRSDAPVGCTGLLPESVPLRLAVNLPVLAGFVAGSFGSCPTLKKAASPTRELAPSKAPLQTKVPTSRPTLPIGNSNSPENIT